MSAILSVKDISVGVPGRTILNSASFDIEAGDSVAVIGPNGAGKSMLVKTLAGLIQPLSGSITWSKNSKLGYVPQKFTIGRHIPLLTSEFLQLKEQVTPDDAKRALERVGLSGMENRPVRVLSGGQFQRLIIAWAIVDNPNVLIFDEPTESVDVAGQESIYSLLKELSLKEGITVFLVTHDLDIVHRYSKKVICLSEGSLVCSAAPVASLDSEAIQRIYGHESHRHGI